MNRHSQSPLLGRVLKRKTRQLGRFLCRQPMGGGGSGIRIGQLCQCRSAISEARNHGCGLAGMLRAQSRIDGGERLVAFGTLRRDKQLHLCCENG